MADWYILDENGNPKKSTLTEAAPWFENHDNRRVALTQIFGVRISTVFLGLDHSFGRKGPPILFETMIFGGPLDQEQERYHTKEEALVGHEAMVKKVREAMD